MKINFYLSLSYFSCVLLALGLLFASCEKIPGHAITPAGSTTTSGSSGGSGGAGSGNGIGPIAIGPVNTIIFQVDNDRTYTLTASKYKFSGNFTSNAILFGGPYTSFGVDTVGRGGIFYFGFQSITAGTFTPSQLGVSYGNLDIQNFGGGTEMINVVAETPIGDTSSGTGSTSGTMKGTFDGYMVGRLNSSQKVRVAGSFNISL